MGFLGTEKLSKIYLLVTRYTIHRIWMYSMVPTSLQRHQQDSKTCGKIWLLTVQVILVYSEDDLL